VTESPFKSDEIALAFLRFLLAYLLLSIDDDDDDDPRAARRSAKKNSASVATKRRKSRLRATNADVFLPIFIKVR
jgi:uncharacterized protein (UPF0147 family)